MFRTSSPVFFTLLLFLLIAMPSLSAQDRYEEAAGIDWFASAGMNLGSGDFAPYYISALDNGKVTRSKGLLLDIGLSHKIDTTRRFSWGAATEFCGGIASSVPYLKYEASGQMVSHDMRPPCFWLQQLYGEVKYRSLFLTAGMKDTRSFLLDNSLTSGDLVESGNARPIPQIRAGFIDFQNIPFTSGWVQIQGEIAYGKFVDNGWIEDFYSYANSHINTGAFFIYRHLYLRSKPSENFCFTFGMQASGEIGGTTRWYKEGQLLREEKQNTSFGKLLSMIIPTQSGSGVGEYYDGNNLGSWDFMLRYRLPSCKYELKAYLQKPWEKGSSVGWKNGWDGLWGFQFTVSEGSPAFKSALFEYLTFMNQSGPIHFAPHDNPGTTITTDASGRDDYYNNYAYNSYANYGVSMGTPFLKSPIYNLDGYPQFADNLVRGFHIAATGYISPLWTWKAAMSYRKAYGNGAFPRALPLDDFSWLLESEGQLSSLPGMHFKLSIAMDRGTLLGNNFGFSVGAVYKGNFNWRKK